MPSSIFVLQAGTHLLCLFVWTRQRRHVAFGLNLGLKHRVGIVAPAIFTAERMEELGFANTF